MSAPDFASLAASWSPYGGALTPADRADLETMLRDAYAAGLRDAPLDWSRLSPRQQWEALRSAPKVAGPWERVEGAVRRQLMDGVHGYARITDDGDLYEHARLVAEAMTVASYDAALVAAGWVLVVDDDKETTR